MPPTEIVLKSLFNCKPVCLLTMNFLHNITFAVAPLMKIASTSTAMKSTDPIWSEADNKKDCRSLILIWLIKSTSLRVDLQPNMEIRCLLH